MLSYSNFQVQFKQYFIKTKMVGHSGLISHLVVFCLLTIFVEQNVVSGCSGGPSGTCPYGEFLCNDLKGCYKEDEKCNNKKDCSDGSDEDNHHCGKVTLSC